MIGSTHYQQNNTKSDQCEKLGKFFYTHSLCVSETVNKQFTLSNSLITHYNLLPHGAAIAAASVLWLGVQTKQTVPHKRIHQGASLLLFVNQVCRPHHKSTFVDCTFEQPSESMWDAAEAKKALSKGIVTGISDTFVRACKKLKLPFEQHGLYRNWLVQCGRNNYSGPITPDMLPTSKGTHSTVDKLPAGWTLPYPTGSTWRRIKNKSNSDSSDEIQQQHLEALQAEVRRDLQDQKQNFREHGTYCFSITSSVSPIIETRAHAFQGTGKRKKPKQRAALGENAPPQSMRQALDRDNALEWAESMDSEMEGLTKMGVLLHDQTLADCREAGITSKPVPMGLYFDEKTDQTGNVVKLKSRAAIQGHKGNMQKGVHFNETYAATPQEDTGRLLVCLAVQYNLQRRSYDVAKAYCCADIPPEERNILCYPDGFKRFDKITREQLFMIGLKNLYGDPAAGRRWSVHRDRKMLTEFSSTEERKTPWLSKRTVMDPTLFKLTYKPPNKPRQYMLLSMHTDDFDAAGSDDEILDEFDKHVNTFWTLVRTDVDYMLGQERVPLFNDQGRLISITLRMSAYIRGMALTFKGKLPTKPVNEPFNPKSKVSKDMVVDPAESTLVLAAGYLRAVGLILWAARHVHPESKFGISILGSVAHKSSWLAFNDAMWMIKWMEQNQDRGIKFSADGNSMPIGMADASNKPVMSTGLCQGGFCIMLQNGPLASISVRMHHVGLSSEHNEYMALFLLIKRIIWLRQLLKELGYDEMISAPTACYGDNVQANRLCKEHFISPGNQYIATQYHFNKEKVQSGDVDIFWIATKYNLADIFTKALSKQVLDQLLNYLLGFAGDCKVLFEATRLILLERAQKK